MIHQNLNIKKVFLVIRWGRVQDMWPCTGCLVSESFLTEAAVPDRFGLNLQNDCCLAYEILQSLNLWIPACAAQHKA